MKRGEEEERKGGKMIKGGKFLPVQPVLHHHFLNKETLLQTDKILMYDLLPGYLRQESLSSCIPYSFLFKSQSCSLIKNAMYSSLTRERKNESMTEIKLATKSAKSNNLYKKVQKTKNIC